MSEELELLYKQIREESDPFTKAKLLNSIKQNKQVTLRVVSAELKLKPSYLSHILRLLKLPPLIVDGYYSQLVTLSHLFILSRLPEEKNMVELYEKILSENLTSLQTEELVREILYGVKSTGVRLEKADVEEFVKKMGEQSKKVKIIQSRSKGKLIIEVEGELVKTSEELKRMMDLLQVPTHEDTGK